jgi:transcription elongation factor S-II
MSKQTLSCVLLTSKGDVRRANIPTSEGTLSMDCLQKYLKRKEIPQELCTGKYRNYIIYVVGFKTGRKGTESKAQFPASNCGQVFGDAIALMSSDEDHWNDGALPISPEQWKEFIETQTSIIKEDDCILEEDEDEELAEDDETDDDVEEDDVEEDAAEEDIEGEGEGDIDIEGDLDAEEEFQLEPEPVKRKKPVLPRGDTALRVEIDRNSDANSHPLRLHTLSILSAVTALSSLEHTDLEMAIFQTAFDTARLRFIPRNWKSPQFTEIYSLLCRKVASNIHPSSPVTNPRILSRIKSGEIPITALPTMSAYDLFPENWKDLSDKQLIREQKLLEGNRSRATDQYKCHRCGKSETTYYEMQTRSADEPTTIFITCLNCGKQWRQ